MNEIRESSVNPEAVRCKVVELPLNYHRVRVRYQLRTPPKGGLTKEKWFGRCSTYLKMWIELVIAEKRRQMHASAEMWPYGALAGGWCFRHAHGVVAVEGAQ